MMLTLTVGDTGTTLEGTVNAKLQGASVQVTVTRPGGSKVVKTATVADAATGKWAITWASGDLNVAGVYSVEPRVTFSDGSVQSYPTVDGRQPVRFQVRAAA